MITNWAEQMKLFVFQGVLCGCYTGGIAFVVAESTDEAIEKLVSLFEKDQEKEKSQFHTGTWDANRLHDAPQRPYFKATHRAERLEAFRAELEGAAKDCMLTLPILNGKGGYQGGAD